MVVSRAPAISLAQDRLATFIGARLREGRTLRGLNYRQLSRQMGIPWVSIQSYENARGRTSAAMLFLFADALNLPITFFYSGIEDVLGEVRHLDVDEGVGL